MMDPDELASEIMRLSGEVAALRLVFLGFVAQQDLGTRRALSASLSDAAERALAMRPTDGVHQQESDHAFGQLARACNELAHCIDAIIKQQH